MKSIRFATIGSNFIVDSFLRGAAHDERFEHVAVYSRTLERGREFAAKHSGPLSDDNACRGAACNQGAEVQPKAMQLKIYTSLEDLARDPEVDAVYVASPNICHAAQSILMMEHGKHVICEKPMAPTFAEVQSMVAAARKNGVTLMEAMKTTLLPNYAAVREALPKIGKVRRFFAQFCQYSSRYDSFREGIVLNAFNPAMKGGALLDLGVYGIAPLVHLFGMPEKVQCSETMLYPKNSTTAYGNDTLMRGIDGQGTMLLTYPEMEGVIMYSKISDSTLPTEIQGEEGRILISKLSQMIEPRIVYRDGRTEDISVPTIDDNMYYEVREFIDLILSGRIESDENTFERSLQVLELVEKA